MKCPFIKEKSNARSDVPQDCLKDECALWVKLMADKQEQGKCAFAWGAMLLTEIRVAIEKSKTLVAN